MCFYQLFIVIDTWGTLHNVYRYEVLQPFPPYHPVLSEFPLSFTFFRIQDSFDLTDMAFQAWSRQCTTVVQTCWVCNKFIISFVHSKIDHSSIPFDKNISANLTLFEESSIYFSCLRILYENDRCENICILVLLKKFFV